MEYFTLTNNRIDTKSLSLREDTFTSAYNEMDLEVKKLYMQNCFDGDLSTVYYQSDQIIGFVLVAIESVLTNVVPNSRHICKIVGYSSVSTLEIELFRRAIFKLKNVSMLKPPRRFKGKFSHLIIECCNRKQEKICSELEIELFSIIPNTYIIKFR